jgi:RNA polymerase sigma-70 factor, ECF subfamily
MGNYLMAKDDSSPTRQLMEQAQAGRTEAVDKLLDLHRPYLRQLVSLRLDRLLRARVDPSDVVQEAQMEALRRLDQYLQRPEMPFRLWLRQIALDRLIMLRRRHLGAARRSLQREVRLPEGSSVALAQQLLAAGSTPSERLADRELARRVRLALAELNEADREILLLRNFEGLSNQEVAGVLEINGAAASQRYGRALLRLRSLLVDKGVSEGQS